MRRRDLGPGARRLADLIETATDVDPFDDDATTLFGRETPPPPSERVPDLLADAASIVGVVPRLDRSLLDALRSGDRDLTAVVVVTGRARERLTGPTRLAARSALETRDVTVYAHDGDSPVGLLLVDDQVVAGVFDENGLAAALCSDAPAIREWAVGTCKRYRSASTLLFE